MSKRTAKPGPTGRPTKYREEYGRIAYRMCLLGAKNEDITQALEIGVATFERWRVGQPGFRRALKEGREEADANVGKALYQRACGYTHKAVKIFADPKTGAQKIVPYKEHYAPDTTACIFWLKNRRPDLWRDRQEHQITQTVSGLTEDILERARTFSLPKPAAPATNGNGRS